MSIVLIGSTSGSVTLQEPAVAGSTVLDLPATSGTILTSASAITSSQMPSGSIIQVAQYLNYNYASTTNSSFTATGFAVTITPKSASSTMLIRCAISASQSASNGAGYFTIYKNGSNLAGANGYNTLYSNASFSNPFRIGIPIEITNASGGTSAITYEIYFKTNTVGTVGMNQDSTASSITVMEIAP
jgi:hypothetical protein